MPILETTFTADKKNLMELHRELYRKTAVRFRWFALVGAALFLVGVFLWPQNTLENPNGAPLVCFLGIFWTVFALVSAERPARKATKSILKFNRKHYDGEVVTRTKFYGKTIAATNEATGNEKKVAMEEVSRVLRTEHLLAIILADRSCIMADLRSLAEEDGEELWDRLTENCTEAVIEQA